MSNTKLQTSVAEILQCQRDVMSRLERLDSEIRAVNLQSDGGQLSGDEAQAGEMFGADQTGIALPPLKIAAFNIQIFGTKKLGKTDVIGVLVKILCRYDLILIQEIRDSSETALDNLVSMCTQVDPGNPFESVVSERLGRGNCKEQYAFMYRTSRLSVADTYQYDDGEDDGSDVFQREPFAVRFTSPTTEITDFAIIAIHTSPEDAVKEIGALHKVYDSTKKHWDLEDIMVAGDFNADEGYVDQEDWAKIALRNDRRFRWLIKDETDTTVGNTDRAYDRFVVAGKKLVKAVVPGSAGVFQFDKELGLSVEEAEDVSDHFPIELELLGRVNHDIQDNLYTNLSFEVSQKLPIEHENLIRKIYRTDTGPDSAYFQSHVHYDQSSMAEVVAKRAGVDDVIAALQEFKSCFPGVVSQTTIEMTRACLESSSLSSKPYVYGLQNQGGDWSKFELTVRASLKEPLLCSVFVSRRMS
ncbi:deoxyribonuclease-1 [Aplysia californica]|uniref:Deoxyribonuclease-1 n=1 Tax=Aplysia californica TaxID=6500 RepID=A0ABM1A253_APLCA|nr:deoxyribonuclease-1 [Aplysia californica]